MNQVKEEYWHKTFLNGSAYGAFKDQYEGMYDEIEFDNDTITISVTEQDYLQKPYIRAVWDFAHQLDAIASVVG